MTETDLKKEDLMAGLFGIDKSLANEGGKSDSDGQKLAIDQLYPSERNHYHVEMDDAMEELIASIKMNGILMPLIVRMRKEEPGYEIISGHRRHTAATVAGLKTVPVVIKDLSDEDRDIIIADSNLQRPQIRISEKAWAIRLKYDAIKKQVGRNGEEQSNGAPGAPLGKSTDVIAQKMGLAETTIKRYNRLTYLIPQLLEKMVDTGILPLKAGVQLSYLPEPVQQYIFDVLDVEKIKVNEDLAKALREQLSKTATIDDVYGLLKPERKLSEQAVRRIGIKVNKDIRKKYFPKDYDDEQVHKVMIELLDAWAAEWNPEYENYKPEYENGRREHV